MSPTEPSSPSSSTAPAPPIPQEGIQFHAWPQRLAQTTFTRLLPPHFPSAAKLYNRLLVPHNTLERRCLFAATFPPPSAAVTSLGTLGREGGGGGGGGGEGGGGGGGGGEGEGVGNETPEIYTLVFADRSRHEESQIWVFNPLINELPLPPRDENPSLFADPASADNSTNQSTITTTPEATQQQQQNERREALLNAHIRALLLFLKSPAGTEIRDAPGYPFMKVCRFGCVHPVLARAFRVVCEADEKSEGNLGRYLFDTRWEQWFLKLPIAVTSTGGVTQELKEGEETAHSQPPQGFRFSPVPESQLELVTSTSGIKRQPSTLLALPNVALLIDNEEEEDDGRMVSWMYVGMDGALSTLFTVEEYRGRGLGLAVARECVRRLGRGGFRVRAGGWADIAGGEVGGEVDGKEVVGSGKMGEELEGEDRMWAWDGPRVGWTYSDVHKGNRGSESVMARLGARVKWESRYIRIELGE